MKIFRFHDPSDHRFAQAARRGTWEPADSGGVCPECTGSRQRRVPPLRISWERGSTFFGDFIWPGFDDEIVVTQRVLETLSEHFHGFEGKPVEIVEDLQQPRRVERVEHRGPTVFDLWVTAWDSADRSRSTIELEQVCCTCGTERWKVQLPPAGAIYVSPTELDGAGIFRIHEAPAWIACTEELKLQIEMERFTNVSFIELGEITQPK